MLTVKPIAFCSLTQAAQLPGAGSSPSCSLPKAPVGSWMQRGEDVWETGVQRLSCTAPSTACSPGSGRLKLHQAVQVLTADGLHSPLPGLS